MELKEFTQKFLPDYDVRLSNYRVSYFRNNLIGWQKRGTSSFCRLNFPEALQNFADRICKVQRDNCASEKCVFYGEYNGILIEHAAQPKIEEL